MEFDHSWHHCKADKKLIYDRTEEIYNFNCPNFASIVIKVEMPIIGGMMKAINVRVEATSAYRIFGLNIFDNRL